MRKRWRKLRGHHVKSLKSSFKLHQESLDPKSESFPESCVYHELHSGIWRNLDLLGSIAPVANNGVSHMRQVTANLVLSWVKHGQTMQKNGAVTNFQLGVGLLKCWSVARICRMSDLSKSVNRPWMQLEWPYTLSPSKQPLGFCMQRTQTRYIYIYVYMLIYIYIYILL